MVWFEDGGIVCYFYHPEVARLGRQKARACPSNHTHPAVAVNRTQSSGGYNSCGQSSLNSQPGVTSGE